MNQYTNALAPWECKSEHFRNIQLGTDFDTLAQSLSDQTKALMQARLFSSNDLISSPDRIQEGVDVMAYGEDKVRRGMAGLKSAFEWGIGDVVWQIEQKREKLIDILAVLQAPITAEAKERKWQAVEAYAKGQMDHAETEFIAAEALNPSDFSIHIGLGVIYLFHKIDKSKALNHFKAAITHAKPVSAYYTSYAMLHAALTLRDAGKVEAAERLTADAAASTPDFAEAVYQNAHYNALLNNSEKTVAMLERAILLDVNYCEKIQNESDFSHLWQPILALFDRMRTHQTETAEDHSETVHQTYTTLLSTLGKSRLFDEVDYHNSALENALDRIDTLIKRHSYRDSLEAAQAAERIIHTRQIHKHWLTIRSGLESQLTQYQSESKAIQKKIQEHDGHPLIDKRIGLIGTAMAITLFGIFFCLTFGMALGLLITVAAVGLLSAFFLRTILAVAKETKRLRSNLKQIDTHRRQINQAITLCAQSLDI